MTELITGILSLFSMIGIGLILAKSGLITTEFNQSLSKILIRAIFPISLFRSAYTEFQDRAMLGQFKYILISFSLIIGAYLLLVILGKILNLNTSHIGVTRSGAVFSNTIFMGLPLAIAFLGDQSSLYVMLYFMSNTVLFWMMGVYFFDRSKGSLSLSKIIAPPMRGFFLGLVLALIGLQLPEFLMVAVDKVANTSTPLAMFYIGGMFYFTDYKSLAFDKSLIVVILFKLIAFPLLTLALFSLPIFDSVPLLLKQTFCVLAAMPTQNQVALAAGERNVHKEYANTLVLSTTLLSGITIPVISGIIMYFLK